MDAHKKTCFINVGIDPWYTHGSDRLKGSLIDKGFAGDLLFWKDEWPSNSYDRKTIYNVKPDAFEQAIKRGYTTIIWGDSSIYALRNTARFVSKVNEKGYWLGQSGYNCAEVCSDACLTYFGVDRDWAEKVPDSATGIFGVNLDHEGPREFIETWIQAAKDGVFKGSRHHGGQSKDTRFKFYRQDQSCASVIAGKMGMRLDTFFDETAFAWDVVTEQTFKCQGM